MKQNKNEANVLKPVKEYRKPVYPGKEAFIDNPSLLLNYAPPSWMKTKLSAAALLVFALNTCQGSRNEDLNRQDTRMVEQKDIKQTQKSVTQKKISIAPLFIHGEGTGATGCIVISPPSFLSEADAIELIQSKLEKEKIIFDKQHYAFNDVYSLDEYSAKHPFYFDFYSSRYNLGIKFICQDNYFTLSALRSVSQDKREAESNSFSLSSVQAYDMIKTSQRIREYFKERNDVNIVIFYDPLVQGEGVSGFFNIHTLDISRLIKTSGRLLEEQVGDFAVWFRNTFDESGKR